MKKFILSAAIGIALALPIGGIASAASDNHLLPGTPGDKNCSGQTMAYLAQGNVLEGPGIGNVASQANLSVKEVKAIVAAYCNP